MSEVKDWVIVPKFATESMVQAGIATPVADSGNDDDDQPEDYKRVYSAMLEAAPKWSANDLRVIPIGQIRTDVERANCIWFGPLPKHGTDIYAAHDFDAQRLRADTAEAERDGAMAANAILREEVRTERLRADAAVGDANEAERKLAVAEQRIAEMVAAFAPLLKNWDDLAAGESLNVDRARAALNPNPEAESK